MGYTNIFATMIATDVLKFLSNGIGVTNGLLSVAHKEYLNDGEHTRKVVLPGSVVTTTRTAGSAGIVGTAPTDSAVSLTPATEYGSGIPMDRLDSAAAILDAMNRYAPLCANAILSDINQALWALVNESNFPKPIGTLGSTPPPEICSQARQAIKKAKCKDTTQLHVVVGGEEWQTWAPAMRWDAYGPTGQKALETGSPGRLYGVIPVEDQDRPASDGGSTNIALHPMALMVGFRRNIPERGYPMGKAIDPDTGMTVFTELKPIDNATNGVGQQLDVFVVADVKAGYTPWGKIIYGAAA